LPAILRAVEARANGRAIHFEIDSRQETQDIERRDPSGEPGLVSFGSICSEPLLDQMFAKTSKGARPLFFTDEPGIRVKGELLKARRTSGDTYGVVAAQRRKNQVPWIVIAGATALATSVTAESVGLSPSMQASLPEAQNS
jgi:hypothetical protein